MIKLSGTIAEGLRKSLYWGKGTAAANSRSTSTLATGATQLFESVYDPAILAWVPELKERINHVMKMKARHEGQDHAPLLYAHPYAPQHHRLSCPHLLFMR